MTLFDLAIIVGIGLAIFGFIRRKEKSGKWMLTAGLGLILLALITIGWTDLKSGFVDGFRE